jgi:Rhodopirellula transposase DDE domain
LRVSIDAKAVVKIGEFDRGGKSRVYRKANDHDFHVIGKTTPVGFLIPNSSDLSLYMVSSSVTSDCIVDLLQQWWDEKKQILPLVDQLVINLDNGPEQQSHRTQFMKRIQDFCNQNRIKIQLAYYPPYHSKYNPIERTFGILEQHWNGELLDSLDAVYGYARSMTWKGIHPIVKIIEEQYKKGITVGKKVMDALNAGFERLKGLDKWFVIVRPEEQSG